MLCLYVVVAIRNIIHRCIFAISSLLKRVTSFKFPNMITRIGRTDHTLPIMQEGPPTDDLSHHRDNSSSACSAFAEHPTSIKGLASEDGKASRPAVARQRFKGAVRSVIIMQQQASRPSMPQRIPSFDWNSAVGMSPTRPSSVDLDVTQGPRATLIPKLKTLEPVQDLSVHTALVRHLQFSPSGKYLATSRCVVTSPSDLLVLR